MPPRKPRSRASGRVTLADVAARAGVSAISVSRTLQSPAQVSAALRARIQAAIAELGYVPDHAARSLASARSGTVVVLVPSLGNAVFVETLTAIQAVLQPRGWQMLIGNTRYSPAEEEALLLAWLGHRPDGILLSGLDQTGRTRALLAGSGAPVVHMMEIDATGTCCSVGSGQEAAGAAMAGHLLARGYRRIAFIAVQLDPRTRQRREGWRRVMREAGCYEPARDLESPQPSSVGVGVAMLERLLAQAPDSDAVFCCNDDLAHGVLFECQRRGIDVPGRLAVAGFNDLPASAWTHPRLTTIAIPRTGIGQEAARLLTELMGGRAPAQRTIDLGFELKARDST